MLVFVLTLVIGSLLVASVSAHRGLQAASIRSGHLFHSLDWIITALRLPLATAVAFCVLSSAVLTVFWSHRFAGPLRVLTAAMAKLSEGDFTSALRIRRWDALSVLAEDFLRMQEGLKAIVAADHKNSLEISRRLTHLSHTIPEDHPSYAEIQQLAHDVKAIGSRYQI